MIFWSNMSVTKIFHKIRNFRGQNFVFLESAPIVNKFHGKIIIFAVWSADLRSG